MSLQNAIDFAATVAKTPSLAEEINQAVTGKSTVDAMAIYMEIGKRHGYDFPAEEAAEFRAQDSQSTELSEADLDMVAGGGGTMLPSTDGGSPVPNEPYSGPAPGGGGSTKIDPFAGI